MKYVYSISIPHFNTPQLLKRMLSSIPERDDIQVIVVDDGSSSEAISELKLLTHKNLEIIFLEKNRGGGYARNVGLSKATGDWFISVDSDDFFSKGAFDILDQYIREKDIDVVMFCINTINQDGSLSSYLPKANKSVLRYLQEKNRKNENLLRFYNLETWNKLVSLDFIRRKGIKYENCRVNIDVYYSIQIGLKAKKIRVIPDKLYNWVITSGSITQKKRTIEREFQFYLQVQKRNTFYKMIGLKYFPYYRPDILYVPFMIKKRGILDAYRFFRYRYKNIDKVKSARLEYLHLLKDDKN